ncbi:peptidase E [Ammonicoccus fulvus]|uniref:Peptidase E n=1 Tax=Ammonicoccus fulvus TaxID=3138240 RepID=A0ABZ3FQM7_9ACTN
MTTHIVAMGGGGFSMSSNGAVTHLDRYIVNLSDAKTPHVCFVPTASADDPRYINSFLTAYAPMGVRTSVLTLWENASDSIKRAAHEADVLLVGGGSTVNLVALWEAHGLTHTIRDVMKDRNIVLAGISAGANVWFQACSTDSFGPTLRPWHGGMGLIKGSFCPHFDGEQNRAPDFASWIAEGRLPDGYGADDGAAVHVQVDGKTRYVAERRNAHVHRVYGSFTPTTSGVIVEPLKTKLI